MRACLIGLKTTLQISFSVAFVFAQEGEFDTALDAVEGLTQHVEKSMLAHDINNTEVYATALSHLVMTGDVPQQVASQPEYQGRPLLPIHVKSYGMRNLIANPEEAAILYKGLDALAAVQLWINAEGKEFKVKKVVAQPKDSNPHCQKAYDYFINLVQSRASELKKFSDLTAGEDKDRGQQFSYEESPYAGVVHMRTIMPSIERAKAILKSYPWIKRFETMTVVASKWSSDILPSDIVKMHINGDIYNDMENLAIVPIRAARLNLEEALKEIGYPDKKQPLDDKSKNALAKAEELQHLIALKTGPGFSLKHTDNTPLEDEMIKGMAMATAVEEIFRPSLSKSANIYSDSPSDSLTIEHRKIVQSIYWWQAAQEDYSVFYKGDQDAMKKVHRDSPKASQTTVCIVAKDQCFYWDGTPKSYNTPYNIVARLQALYEAYIREKQIQFAEISTTLWAKRTNLQMEPLYLLPLSIIMKHYADNGVESVNEKFCKIINAKFSMSYGFISSYFITPGQQGWKLHISSTPEKSLLLATVVLPIIESFGLSHKIMRYNTQIEEQLQDDSTQRGKVITIYTPYKMHPNVVVGDKKNKEITVALIKALDTALLNAKASKLLKDEDIIKPLTEMLVGDSGFLTIRYGVYSGNFVYDYSDINLRYTYDDRDYSFPSFMLPFYNTAFPSELNLRSPTLPPKQATF